jgi:hypothetical protein
MASSKVCTPAFPDLPLQFVTNSTAPHRTSPCNPPILINGYSTGHTTPSSASRPTPTLDVFRPGLQLTRAKQSPTPPLTLHIRRLAGSYTPRHTKEERLCQCGRRGRGSPRDGRSHIVGAYADRVIKAAHNVAAWRLQVRWPRDAAE